MRVPSPKSYNTTVLQQSMIATGTRSVRKKVPGTVAGKSVNLITSNNIRKEDSL